MTDELKLKMAEILSRGRVGQIVIENNGSITYNEADKQTTAVEAVPEESKAVVEEATVEAVKGIFFGNADVARKFLTEITGVKSTQVIEIVGLYLEKKEISELSCHRDLWNILHNNGLYEPSESNWNKAINKL